MQIDYKYLCNGLGHLTGLETRVYKNKELMERYSHCDFAPDFGKLIYHSINQTEENAFYIETEDLLIFGVIQSPKDETILMIGPTSQIRPGKRETVAILYLLDEPYSRLPDLQNYFANMIPYPFETFLEILCFVNYALNDEKLSVAHLIKKSNQFTTMTSNQSNTNQGNQQADTHNTFQAEQIMLSYITAGNVNAVHSLIQSPPIGRSGSIAHNELRQRKNTFICAATLFSRAAIAGGLASDTAFTLSDRYIQKAELLTNSGDITTLNMEMLLDYTQRVEALKLNNNDSNLSKEVMRYVLKNISKKIVITDIAKKLNRNRTYLCEKFKADTGHTIGDFISSMKMDEAKRMLKISNLTIAHISDYLAFSSQSYFQNVFKKTVGCTPKEYRAGVQTEQNQI